MSINQQPGAQVWQWELKKFIAHRSDQFFEEAVNMAEKATSLTPAQISKLQMIAYSASKFSDLLDYIKLQTGRRKEWREKEKEFGKSLLQVAVKLGGEADKAIKDCNVPAEFAESEKIRTKIVLAREYIKHIVAHYHYSQGGGKK